ncbi:MAG: glycosyl transferase family 2 [Bacteroidetes bacterium RIFCSPLOWO2_12_FULL_35_15]|nr:MAG: glycosyl transferase family 2 [Bacteroidetes bacterium RIFCSPLOWO2_12_FULL_35_15]
MNDISENTLLSIIIPIYNEEDNIANLIVELNKCFGKSTIEVEFVFVDDGSQDLTLSKLFELGKQLCFQSKIIKLSKNYGSHPALRAGILHSKAKCITFLSADLQDPPTLPETLYNELCKGYDIVWAQRESTQAGWFEKGFSFMYAKLMRKYAIPSYPLKGFDIVIFNEKVKKSLIDNIEANSSLFLQILNLGFKQSYISYHKNKRIFGKSKWTLSKKIKLFVDSFIAFSYAPIRLVTLTGFLLFFIGLLWTIFIVIRKVVYNDLEAGWPALVSILMLGFGTTNISLGIIAEYLWRTLDSSRKRPVFIIDEIIEINKNATT